MWFFKNKEKERANALQVQLQMLLDERQVEKDAMQAEKDAYAAELFAEEEVERLAAEEAKRKNAEKEIATKAKEPYINIVSMDMDPANGANVGAIEMDWNVYFIEMLQKNGYVGVSDEDAVDQWFRDVCKHVVLETYENETNNDNVTRADIGNGLAEYS